MDIMTNWYNMHTPLAQEKNTNKARKFTYVQMNQPNVHMKQNRQTWLFSENSLPTPLAFSWNVRGVGKSGKETQ